MNNRFKAALQVLLSADGEMSESDAMIVSQAMAGLSEYKNGFILFDRSLINATAKECREVLDHYLKRRTDEDRKAKGRFYTPQPLTRAMRERALTPVLEDRLNAKRVPATILTLKICDPACGTGCFLVEAIRQPAYRLALMLSNGERPSKATIEASSMLVAENCIYGVDLDPLAIELCRLALWLSIARHEQLKHLPLPPLSKIRCGNSLIGVQDWRVLKKGIPDGFYNPSNGDDKAVCQKLKRINALEVANLDIRSGFKTADQLMAACDCWTSIPFMRKTKGSSIPTTRIIQDILNGSQLTEEQLKIVDEARRLSKVHRFFHWSLEFPEVFNGAFAPY